MRRATMALVASTLVLGTGTAWAQPTAGAQPAPAPQPMPEAQPAPAPQPMQPMAQPAPAPQPMQPMAQPAPAAQPMPGQWPPPEPTERKLGSPGQVVIGVDRVMGISSEAIERSGEFSDGVDTYTYTVTTTQTHIGLFGAQHLGGGEANSVALLPRIAFDFFPTNGLSLGVSVMYVTTSGEAELESDDPLLPSEQYDTDTYATLLLAPRIGFAAPVGEVVAIWPRVGITYNNLSMEDEDGNEASISATQLALEGMLAITPVPHFALLIGPFGDISLSGEAERKYDDGTGVTVTEKDDFSYTAFGLAAGIAGYFP